VEEFGNIGHDGSLIRDFDVAQILDFQESLQSAQKQQIDIPEYQATAQPL
jgi:hypothetical protein